MSGITNSTIPVLNRRIVQRHSPVSKWVQIGLDCTLVIGLLFVLTWNKTGDFPSQYRTLAVITVLLMLSTYSSYGYYSHWMNNFNSVWTLLKAWSTVIVTFIVISFVTKTSASFSREVIITWAASGFIAQIASFYFCQYAQSRSHTARIPTLVIGAHALGKHLVKHINKNAWIPDQIVGVVEDDDEVSNAWDIKGTPVLGKLEDLARLIPLHQIHRIYIALPTTQADQVQPLFIKFADKNIDIIWAPDIFGLNLLNHQIKEIAGVPLISLSETPLIGTSALMKAVMDRTLATLGLIAISPLMLATALAIKITSKGPILFKQDRLGWDGKVFSVYKFRSMLMHDDEDGKVTQATKEDDRITAVGRFIRKTSIDELPQLYNIITGSMSLVGPRPHAMVHNEYYANKINAYMSRHRVKPGLTGLAQVNGHRGETDTVEKMQARIEYDLAYINNWSIWFDIKIIFKTIFVLFSKNAY